LKVFGFPIAKVAFMREAGEVLHFVHFHRSVGLEHIARVGQLKADQHGNRTRTVQVGKDINGFLSASLRNGIPMFAVLNRL
jgi:hypothetical protein